jgi:galactose mutarotase-like enzyme
MKAHLRDPRTGRDIPLTLECGFGVGVDDFGVTLKAANFEIEIMTGSRTKPPSVAVTPRDGQKRVIKEFPLGDHGYVGTFKDFFALLRGKRAPSRLTLQKRLQAAIASLTLIKKAYRLAPEGPLPIYQFGTSPKVVFELLDLFQRHRTMGIEMAPGKFVTNDLGHGRPSAESLPGDYAEMQAALAYLEKNGIVTRRRGPDGHFYFTLDSRFFTIDRTPEAFRDEIQRLLQPVHAIRKDVSPIVESPSSVRALAMPGPFTWLRKHHLNFYNALRIRYPRPTFVLMLLTNLVFYGLVPATACDGAWTLARLNAPEGESPLFPGVAAAVKKSLHEGRFILVSGDPETNIERYFLGPLLHEAKLDPAEQKQLPVIALSGMDRYNYQDGEFRGHALLPGMTKEEWRQVKGVVAELLKEIEPQLKETAERLLKDSGKVEYELGFIKELNGISGDVFAYCRPINLTSDSGPVDWGPLDQNPQYRDLLDRFAADATRRIAACLGDMSSPIRAVRSAGHGVDFKRADKGDALNAVELGANEYWVYIGDQFAGGADDASLACRRALIGVQVGPVSESTRKFAAPAGRHLIISDREAKDGAAADYIRIITRVRRLARARARLFGIFRRHPLQNLLIRVAGGVTPDRVAEVLGRPERVAAALQSRATTVAGLEKEIESYRPVLPVVVENANAAVELSPIGNRVISYRRKQPDGSHFDVLKSPAGNKRGLVPTLLPHNRIRDGLVTGLDGHPLDLKWPGLKLDNGHLMHGFLTPDVVWKETGETGEAQDDGGRYHYVTYAADLGEILSDRPKVADYFGYGHITARHKLYEDGSYEQEVRFENRTEHATVFPLAFHNYQAVGERAVIQAPVIARYPLDAQHLPDGPATPELLNTDPNHPETPYNLQQGFPLGEHLYDELYLLDPNGKEADGRHHVRIRDEERGVEIDISADNATHLVLYYTNEGFVCPEFANIASNGLNEPGEKDRLPVVEPRGTAALRMRITVKPLKGRGAGDSEPGTGSSRTLAEEYARLCSRLEELSEHLQLIGQGLAGTRRAHEIYIETLRRRTSTAA